MKNKKTKISVVSNNRKAYIEFKKECERQILRLGLKEWDIEIDHRVLEDDIANSQAVTQMEEEGKIAVITLNKSFTPRDPRRIAKHEICHVLLGKIQTIAGKRWMSEAEMDGEVEALCTRLEKVL